MLAAVVFKVSLDLAYAWIVPGINYYALLPTHLNWLKLVESYPLIIVGLLALPRDMHRVSTLVVWLIALLMLVPMGTIYAFQDQPRAFMYATSGFFVLVGVLTQLSPEIRLPEPPAWFRRWAVAAIYGALVLVAVAVIVVYSRNTLLTNIARLNIDLSGAYADRADFVSAGLPLKGYYFHWLALVMNPLILTLALLVRRWGLVPLILLLQFAIASEVGARSYFLDLPFVVAVALIALWANPPRVMAYVAAAAVALSAVMVVTLNKLFPFDFITGRFLLVPSQLNFLYYDFFSRYGLIPGQYAFRFFFKVPYPVPYQFVFSPPDVVAGFYYHRPFNFATAGLLADSYMNFGFAGMLLGAIVLVLVLKALDSVSVGIDLRLAVAASVMPAVAITETLFIRVVFTTGLLLLFAVLYCLPRRSSWVPDQRDVDQRDVDQQAPAPRRNLRFMILTQYFAPEIGAAQTRLFNFARGLKAAGHECQVVTALPNYPRGRVFEKYRGRWAVNEEIASIPVIRTWILAVRQSDFRRLLSYFSFQLTSLPRVVSLARHWRPDYVFVESPPLSLGLSGVLLKRWFGIPFVFNVADLWPAWAVEIGAIKPAGLMYRLAVWLETFLYRQADLITVVVEQMTEALAAKGVPRSKVLFLPNGVNVREFHATAAGDGQQPTVRSIKEAAGGRPVVLYAGTLGAYHGLELALDAAALLQDTPVLFAFVGDGSEKPRLMAKAAAMQLDNVAFYDPVPVGDMPTLMSAADIALSVIRIPTRAAKVAPAMAAAVPIVYAGRGEGAELVRQAGAGIVVDPDRADDIALSVKQLLDDHALASRLGANGRRYAVDNLDWDRLVATWLATLEERRPDSMPSVAKTDSGLQVPSA